MRPSLIEASASLALQRLEKKRSHRDGVPSVLSGVWRCVDLLVVEDYPGVDRNRGGVMRITRMDPLQRGQRKRALPCSSFTGNGTRSTH